MAEMKILLVEDDHMQVDWIEEVLSDASSIDGDDAEITNIKNESDFRNALDQLADNLPDLVIMDVMLPWCESEPDMPETPEEVKADHHRAGLRCRKLLKDDPRTANVPVLLYTVLGRDFLDRDARIEYLSKGTGVEALRSKIKQLTLSSR